jgi:hypothetical protein
MNTPDVQAAILRNTLRTSIVITRLRHKQRAVAPPSRHTHIQSAAQQRRPLSSYRRSP